VWLYLYDRAYEAFGVIVISGITDLADGFIARRFNMMSDVGKILDPAADKLTQAALFVCLASNYKLLWLIFAIFAMKEIGMLIMGAIDIKKTDSVTGAKWHGKLNTALVYVTLMLLMLLPNLDPAIANFILIFDGAVMIISFSMYVRFYCKHIKENKK
jgi:cardiolipin synthase